jgi:dihydroorotate dehydrogenase
MKPYKDTLLDRFLAAVRDTIPSAELRHESLALLAQFYRLTSRWEPPPSAACTLTFADGSTPLSLRTPLVLAAGASKRAWFLPAFASFGFGAVTVGTATLRPRSGNPLHPRVRTVEEFGAIQNAMGLNNPGIRELARRISDHRPACEACGLLVGISISEDPDLLAGESPDRNILDCLEIAWPQADYVEINLSCPNTGHERLDRSWDRIRRLLEEVRDFRERQPTRKPVWVKLSPDLSEDALETALESVRSAGLTGAVLFNTWPASTGSWPDGEPLPDLPELGRPTLRGGLSGRPLFPGTLHGVRRAKKFAPALSVVACGGVETGGQFLSLRESGADLVQIYTTLAFRWLAGRKILTES